MPPSRHRLVSQAHHLWETDTTTGGASKGVEERLTYDANGHALITSQYYALGTNLSGRPTGALNPNAPVTGGVAFP